MNKSFELPIKVEGILFAKVGNEYKFLILKRTPEDGNFWQPLTGTVNDGEKLSDCIKRELQEETGLIDPTDITNEIWRFDWKNKKDETIIEFVFGIELNANSPVKLNSSEHSEYKWCNFNEAMKLLGRDNNKKAFEIFKTKIIK